MNRQHFIGKGAKFDTGKDRWELYTWKAAAEVVKVLSFGAEKYGPLSWKEVPNPKRRYFAALMRHLISYFVFNKKVDLETGLSHLAHALCNLGFLLEADLEGLWEEEVNVYSDKEGKNDAI